MFTDLPALQVPLPEDIEKEKWQGNLSAAQHLIQRRLENIQTDQLMRRRLTQELEILHRLPTQYPYPESQALALCQSALSDFTQEEFAALREEGAVDWIYLDGVRHYRDNFLLNLQKTRKDLDARWLDAAFLAEGKASAARLDAVISQMKETGSASAHIHVSAQITVNPETARLGKIVHVQLPIPVEYAQVKNFRLLSVTPEPAHIAPPTYSERSVYFEKKLSVEDVFQVEYEFDNHMRYVCPDPAKAWEDSPSFCTDEVSPHIVFTPHLRALTQELVGTCTNPLEKARRIYDYITQNVKYSFARSYYTITNLTEYTACGLKGDCGLQALLFITLCRCAGVPARWQAGLYAASDHPGHHDWAQFYVEPYGWLYADCSFGGSAWRAGALDRWNFYFGNLDPYRIPLTSKFQQPFYVPMHHSRHDPYDNQAGEIEYTDRAMDSCEYSAQASYVEPVTLAD